MQAFNPYLPSWEYIPDAEPYVFGDRVYIYGSHDRFNAPIFCMNDYVCWSAPLNDPSDWRFSRVIYRKNQDPMNRLGLRLLFAPDVARGTDGRYYLFYAFDFLGVIGVAVCDTPDGEYRFHGHVHYADGTLLGRRRGDDFPFDPGVLVDDDGRVYLYYGFATKVPALLSGFCDLQNRGGMMAELAPDMLTLRSEPKLLFPRRGLAGSFQGHEFFEASSIRKIDGQYVFVYSSANNHELCYAVSDRPDGGFIYGGTLVDQGDLYLNGNADESHAANYLGNTHGGMVMLNGRWYIFYHRQTNRHSYSRQACAEPLVRMDGAAVRFRQAEVTSCGLNGAPLTGKGMYSAHIACNLWSAEGTARYDKPFAGKKHPFFTQRGRDGDENAVPYIANMRNGSVAGFKYFDICGLKSVSVTVSGSGTGAMQVSDAPDFRTICAEIPVKPKTGIYTFEGNIDLSDGKRALYFRYTGNGSVDFYNFALK